MPYTSTSDSYRQISDDLKNALSWLQKMGVSVHPTRLQKYNRDMDMIAKMHENKDHAGLKEKWVDFVHAGYESREIVDIYDGLKNTPITGELKKRLMQYASGPIIISDEIGQGASHTARDIGFELYMGAKLTEAGFDVKFPEDGDLIACHEKSKILVECKRPSNHKRVRDNIEKALRQLSRHYLKDENSVGLISISINKLVNPNQEILIQQDIDELSRNISGFVDRFIRENEHIWQNKKDGRTLGVIVSLQAPTIIKDREMLVIAREVGLNNMTYQDTPEHTFLLQIAKKMGEVL